MHKALLLRQILERRHERQCTRRIQPQLQAIAHQHGQPFGDRNRTARADQRSQEAVAELPLRHLVLARAQVFEDQVEFVERVGPEGRIGGGPVVVDGGHGGIPVQGSEGDRMRQCSASPAVELLFS